MPEFEVSLHNIFEAGTAEDAVRDMIEWLLEAATTSVYRVTDLDTKWEGMIDAEKMR